MDAFFIAAKTTDLFQHPINWVFMLLVSSTVLFRLRRDHVAKRMVTIATILFGVLGVVAIPEYLIQRLENAYPSVPVSARFEGLIVLGGATDISLASREGGQTLLNDAAERLTRTVAVAHQWPQLKILVTGGTSLPQGETDAAAAMRFFIDQGLPSSRFIVESQARNTHEIAVRARVIDGVDASKPWLLLTSAWNMPRALLAFRKQGWNVEPLAVDYRTGATIQFARFSIPAGTSNWDLWLHEALGLLLYRLTGRI